MMIANIARSSSPLALTCTLGLSLLIAGCHDPVRPTPGDRLDPLHPAAYPRVAMLEGLDVGLGLQPPIVEEATGTRPMSVTVPVRSLVDYPINIQYQYQFLDDKGRLIDTRERWRFVHIDPRVQTQLQGSAMDLDAVDWRLQLRPAR
jgi:uncharacterized protein YcfL